MVVPKCPKCGGKGKLKRWLPNTGNSKTRYALVQCLSCLYKTKTIYPFKGESDKSLAKRALDLWDEGRSS